MAIEQVVTNAEDTWFALFVKTGSERSIQKKLHYLDIESLKFHVPCREIRIRQKGQWVLDLQPLFPGYILAHGRLSNSNYSVVRQITDVYTWICDEAGPLQIHPEEITMIRRLIDRNDVIRLSKVMFEGQHIRVLDGPLVGQEAIIKKVDRRKGRVKIALSVFGNEKTVDISVEDVDFV